MKNIGDVIKSFSNLVNHANVENGIEEMESFVELYLKYRSAKSGKDLLHEIQMAEIALKLLKDRLLSKYLELVNDNSSETKEIMPDKPQSKGMKLTQFIKIFGLKPNLRVTMRKNILNGVLIGHKDEKTGDYFIQYKDGVRWLNSKPHLSCFNIEDLKIKIEDNNKIYA